MENEQREKLRQLVSILNFVLSNITCTQNAGKGEWSGPTTSLQPPLIQGLRALILAECLQESPKAALDMPL